MAFVDLTNKTTFLKKKNEICDYDDFSNFV